MRAFGINGPLSAHIRLIGSAMPSGRARCFVRELHGCHNNVIGFPVQRFCQELKQLAASGEL